MISPTLNFDIKNLTYLAIVGMVVKLFVGVDNSSDGNSGPASAAVWGYGLVAASVLLIMFVSFALVSQMERVDMNTLGFIKTLFFAGFPALMMLGVLAWLITINSLHYHQINKGTVADEYNTYSGVSSLLVAAQLGVLIKFLMDDMKMSEGKVLPVREMYKALKSRMASVGYLLTIVNIFLAVIMTIILTYFSTDG